jgi:hypothetical protein
MGSRTLPEDARHPVDLNGLKEEGTAGAGLEFRAGNERRSAKKL